MSILQEQEGLFGRDESGSSSSAGLPDEQPSPSSCPAASGPASRIGRTPAPAPELAHKELLSRVPKVNEFWSLTLDVLPARRGDGVRILAACQDKWLVRSHTNHCSVWVTDRVALCDPVDLPQTGDGVAPGGDAGERPGSVV
jgi:hypothetical protein